MKTLDAAMTIRSSAFATARRSPSPRFELARLVRKSLLTYRLAALLAVCLLAASTNKVWGQLCVCAEPGWMNCDLMGFHSHEPATSAFPQCLAGGGAEEEGNPVGGPAEEEGSPVGGPDIERSVAGQRSFGPGSAPRSVSHIRRNVTRRQPRFAPTPTPGPVAVGTQKANEGVVAAPEAPAFYRFPPPLADQIQPLNCPRGFARIGQTFYGGARCGPMVQPNIPAADLLPPQPPPPSPAPSPAEASTPPAEAPQGTPQPIASGINPDQPVPFLRTPETQPKVPPLGPPPSPVNPVEQANGNVPSILAVLKPTGPLQKFIAYAPPAGATAFAVGFFARRWPMPIP
jgi:hypothetical protein